ncbi:MAG: glycine betaine/L-proline ABC transporter substrate-binding protein ProX [Cyanothece sp. SIO2G6]|nr:glycine betaine/L-proline ABC transporter substrate-binding protein ProX [Cyanothece sp. SIO2G6]
MPFRGFSSIAVAATLAVSVIACQSAPDVATDVPATESATDMPMPGEGVTIRAGHSDWLEEIFTTEIVNIGLDELGYEIADLQQADYSALHLSVANGDLDYNTSFYDPNHQNILANISDADQLALVGEMVIGQEGFFMDKATVEEYSITSIDQLQDPELAKLFDSNDDGKANLAGCQSGWPCNAINTHWIDVYGLKDTVEQDEGQSTILLSDVITRYEQGEPVLFFAYFPHWVFASLKIDEDVVWVEVPFTDLPGEQAELTDADTTVDGKNVGRPPILQRVIANADFLAENPAAAKWFEIVNIPAADISNESLLIKDGENSPEDIRRHAEEWVEANREQFDQWLEEARQAAG